MKSVMFRKCWTVALVAFQILPSGAARRIDMPAP